LGVSICLDMVSIETLDLNGFRKLISTWWTFLTVFKSLSRHEGHSRQFKKRSLDMAYALKSWFLSRSRLRLSISTLLKVDLDMMDILDGFQKLVSTWRTFSISISIGLNCWDPQGYYNTMQLVLKWSHYICDRNKMVRTLIILPKFKATT
jgi:hypothetical protein